MRVLATYSGAVASKSGVSAAAEAVTGSTSTCARAEASRACGGGSIASSAGGGGGASSSGWSASADGSRARAADPSSRGSSVPASALSSVAAPRGSFTCPRIGSQEALSGAGSRTGVTIGHGPGRSGRCADQLTGPVQVSPGPSPGASGNGDASRKASCSDRSPSRSDRACWLPISGAAAVTRAARAVISLRASSRSIRSTPRTPAVSGLSPHMTAAALIRCTAAVVMTSTAGTSAMSRAAAAARASASGEGCWTLASGSVIRRSCQPGPPATLVVDLSVGCPCRRNASPVHKWSPSHPGADSPAQRATGAGSGPTAFGACSRGSTPAYTSVNPREHAPKAVGPNPAPVARWAGLSAPGWDGLHLCTGETFRLHGQLTDRSTTRVAGGPGWQDRRMTDPDANVQQPSPAAATRAAAATRDIAEVPAVEVISTAAVHLMSAAAVKCGLSPDTAGVPGVDLMDLDEARKLITALAGLVTAAAPEIGNQHARSLRDGLRSLQLAFREASQFPDAPGEGPGEAWTGPVS